MKYRWNDEIIYKDDKTTIGKALLNSVNDEFMQGIPKTVTEMQNYFSSFNAKANAMEFTFIGDYTNATECLNIIHSIVIYRFYSNIAPLKLYSDYLYDLPDNNKTTSTYKTLHEESPLTANEDFSIESPSYKSLNSNELDMARIDDNILKIRMNLQADINRIFDKIFLPVLDEYTKYY